MTKPAHPCVLSYDMLALGSRMFNFISDDEAFHFQRENPPGPTVRFTHVEFDDLCYRMRNRFFSWEAYNRAAEAKRWLDDLSHKLGGKSEDGPPEFTDEETNLDQDACLKVLGLSPGFSQKELKTAYREAIKMNHPDKVADMAVEFRELAERRSREINRAYSLLLWKGVMK
jgi:hypothetical protein